MLRSLSAVAIALGLFLAAFALHIVGGATDQGWLFALAVALIFLTAAGFPTIAAVIARRRDLLTIGVGSLLGVTLTGSALWAANDRSMAPWIAFAAPSIVIGVSTLLYSALSPLRASAPPQP